MSAKLEIFLLGVTGYIGGTVLQKLLVHPRRSDFNFTALVRSTEKAEKLKAFGVASVIGSLSDVDTIEASASKSDVTVAMVCVAHVLSSEFIKFFQANADDVPSVEAILRGLKKRYDATGKQPIFINTVRLRVLHLLYADHVVWNRYSPS